MSKLLTLRARTIAIAAAVASAALACSSRARDLVNDGGLTDATSDNGDPSVGDGAVFAPSDDGAAGSADGCASANVELTRAFPDVWLVVAGGHDTTVNDLGAAPVWDFERAALFGPGGVVPSLQQQVAFGFILDGSDYEATPCPTLTPIAPALNASAALQAAYPIAYPSAWGNYQEMQPYALNDVLARLPTAQQQAMDPALGQQAVMVDINNPALCFADFMSNRFADGGPSGETFLAQAQRLTVDAIQALADAGVKVYLFAPNYAVGGSNTAYFDAAVTATGTGQGVFTPASTSDLVAAMTTITGELVSCDVTLDGSVGQGEECRGSVSVDGAPVACDSPDGWRLKDASTVEFVGAACTTLRSRITANVTASFPCSVFVPR